VSAPDRIQPRFFQGAEVGSVRGRAGWCCVFLTLDGEEVSVMIQRHELEKLGRRLAAEAMRYGS
jgi:hypothetical protein